MKTNTVRTYLKFAVAPTAEQLTLVTDLVKLGSAKIYMSKDSPVGEGCTDLGTIVELGRLYDANTYEIVVATSTGDEFGAPFGDGEPDTDFINCFFDEEGMCRIHCLD